MKIAYIISMKSGLPGFNFTEIKELFDRGHEIMLYPTKVNDGPYMPEEDWYVHSWKTRSLMAKQVMYFYRNPLKYSRLALEAIRSRSLLDFFLGNDFSHHMKKNGIEHIHCHFGDHKFFIGYWCKRLTGISLTVTIHSHSLYVNPNWRMFKKALDLSDRVITISEYNKAQLVRKFNVVPDKVTVIRLFVDLEKYHPSEHHNQGSDKLRVFVLGQFDARKGHEDLFHAVSQLDDGSIELWVAGGGSNSNRVIDIEKLAAKYEIDEHVKIYHFPPEDRVIELYQQCDVFCLPSKTAPDGNKEGIPVVLIEAMACGKPVISTIHAGIPEIVDEILVKEGDVIAIKNALKMLIANREKLTDMGSRNRAIIESSYSKKNLDNLEKAFIVK